MVTEAEASKTTTKARKGHKLMPALEYFSRPFDVSDRMLKMEPQTPVLLNSPTSGVFTKL